MRSSKFAIFLLIALSLTTAPPLLGQPVNPGSLGEPLKELPSLDSLLESDPLELLPLCEEYCESNNAMAVGVEEAGIVVRQWNSPKFMKKLIKNPGPQVTGIHALTYNPIIPRHSDFLYEKTLQSIRAKDLRPYPGFHIGGRPKGYDHDNDPDTPEIFVEDLSRRCDQVQHWETMTEWLNAVLAMMEGDEMIVFDGENYYGSGLECLDSSYTADEVEAAMSPFTEALRLSGRRVGYYPSTPTDLVMQNIFDNAAIGSEAWVETSYHQPMHYITNPRLFVRDQHITQHLKEQIERQYTHVHVRQGLFDDALRSWGDLYRLSESFPARTWIYDENRSDREYWGTQDWRDGKCFIYNANSTEPNELFGNLVNVWPMWQGTSAQQVFRNEYGHMWQSYVPNLVSAINSDVAQEFGARNALKKFYTGKNTTGYTPSALLPLDGFSPGGENHLRLLTDLGQYKFVGSQTFKISFILNSADIQSGDTVALLSLWIGPEYYADGSFKSSQQSRRTFNLAVRANELVLQLSTEEEVVSPESGEISAEELIIDPNPPAEKKLTLVFGYDTSGIVNYGYSETGDYMETELTGSLYTDYGRSFAVGAISTKLNQTAEFMKNTKIVGQIINWNSMLTEQSIMGNSAQNSKGALYSDYPFGNYRDQNLGKFCE